MKYLSIQTFQCGISVSGLATFTGGAEINILSLNGATTSSEASLFLGAHSSLEGGQLVLQKGTGQTYAAHLDNYSDQFRVLFGTNTGSAGVAMSINLATRQLTLPTYTSTSSFPGTVAGYLAFDSVGNIITTSLALSGYVPTSRTLTINGTSYDLSADRTWTINTVDYTSRLQHQVKAGVAINKGQAVYVTSADGTNMIVGLASNASEATSSKTMGLLDATVAINGFANVVTEGLLAGLDTSTAGAAGDPVWLGTGGNLIYGLANKPYAPAHLVFIGIVTRKNNSNGEIFVKVQNGFELNEIHDVDIKTTVPVNGHILGFDGTLWVNKTIAGWLGYTPANASGTTNYISKFTGSTTLGNSQIFDNGTNVGISLTTPQKKLDVNGTGIVASFGGTFSPGQFAGLHFGYSESASNNDSYKKSALVFERTDNHAQGGNASGKIHFLLNNIASGSATSLSHSVMVIDTDAVGTLGSARVGIGTANPAANLHINGSNEFTQIIQSTTDVAYTQYYNSTTGTGGTNDGLTIGVNNTYGIIYLRENSDLIFGTANTERIRITSIGNVGIGTSSPSLKFNVEDTGQTYVAQFKGGNSTYIVSGDTSLAGESGLNARNSVGQLFLGISPSAEAYFSGTSGATALGFYLGGTNRIYVNSAGNVGIGTTNPSRKLIVYDTDANVPTIGLRTDGSGTTTGDGFDLQFASSNTFLFNRESGYMSFGTSNTERMRITSAGNVGIGTTSPSSLLNVVATGSAPAALTVQDGARKVKIGRDQIEVTDLSDAVSTMYLQPNANLVINANSGNVGIGTQPSQKLDVNGYAKFTSGIILDGGATSHYREFIWNTSGFNRWDLYVHGAEPGSNVGGDLFLARYADNGAYLANAVTFQRSTGNVGIGTTSPSYKLQVNADGAGLYVLGANTAPYTQTIASFVYGGNSNSINIENQAGKASIQARAGGSTMDLLLNPVSGNVGIGTGSPAAKLDVNGSIYAVGDITIRQSGSSSLSLYRANSGYQAVTHYWEGSGLYWAAGMGYNTYNWVINDTNYGVNNKFVVTQGSTWGVGIGASEPLARLHVGANLSDLSSHTFPNTGAIIASIGVDQTAARTNVLSLLRDGTSGVVYGGLAAFDMSRWQSDGVSTRVQLDLRLSNTDTADIVDVMSWRSNGNVGIGTTSPSQLLHVAGNIRITGAFYDSNNQAGSAGQILKSTGSGTDWVSLSEITGVDGSGTANYVTKWSDADTVTNSLIYDNGTNVGIGTTSPGYNFDVNGQVRVQDKLRVGTVNSGNGVVHMSSSATINPNTTTIVWAQNVSVGMCAFIEYYILNDTSLTDQRAGTIMVTWNQSGTPTIAHTETTTPDIGSTTSINFTSSLVGSDARINAVNSSANPYTIVMSYKYF